MAVNEPRESIEVVVMYAVLLLLDVAFHDGDARDLALAAEAYSVAGYHDGAIMISHGGGSDAVLAAVEAARKGRHKDKLHAVASGMVRSIRQLAEAGVIDYGTCAEASRQRWLNRGGHDLAVSR